MGRFLSSMESLDKTFAARLEDVRSEGRMLRYLRTPNPPREENGRRCGWGHAS
ncbi:hypothetical protein [Cystobacter fuscus]|uniref:hypothetical protein n=1 Tax=Cystobacter fuscus TaxID=43 RepID=UPI0037BED976